MGIFDEEQRKMVAETAVDLDLQSKAQRHEVARIVSDPLYRQTPSRI
jgi:hypothetical protein